MGAFWSALAFVTIAEMGDKTQLVSLAFATRFKPTLVILGVFIATLAVHLFSVAIGEVLGVALPTFWIAIAAGLAFIGFGVWTIRGDELEDGEQGGRFAKYGPLLTVAATFFIAELGDKTMLTTITIASQEMSFIPVWLGSTLGMVIADGLAILIGVAFGRRLPERIIKLGAAAIFIIFGLWTLGQTLYPVVTMQAALG
jgi:putative Ca2+/H+ antiporter (TMEM165/GDT1 family)